MRFKLLLLILLSSALARAQYVQPMNYAHYSFPYQANIGAARLKLTNSSAYLEIGDSLNSKKGLLLPRGKKDSVANPSRGLLFYDLPTNKPWYYNGTTWLDFSTGGSDTTIINHTIDSIFQIIYTNDGLISPGVVIRLFGFTYYVTPAVYRINGITYTSPGDTLTLAAADTLYTRKDRFVLNTTGHAAVVTGIPADPPLDPGITPSQLSLTVATIDPNTTQAAGDVAVIYNENLEWSTSTSGTISANFNSTVHSVNGTKSVAVSSWASGGALEFTNTDPILKSDYGSLSFPLYLTSTLTSVQNIAAQLYMDTAASTDPVAVSIVKTKINDWQMVGLNLSQFSFSSPQYNKLKLIFSGTGSAPLYIDLVELQAGLFQSTGGGVVQNAFGAATDGTNTARAVGNDMLTFASGNNLATATVDSATKKVTTTVSAANIATAIGLADSLANRTQDAYWRNDSMFVLKNGVEYFRYDNRLFYDSTITGLGTAGSPLHVDVTGGGSPIDTTSLSNRINQKVTIGDTAAMLTPYVRKVDTTAMLLPYLRKADTTAMLLPYLRKADTATLSNRINLKLNISDTTGKWVNHIKRSADSVYYRIGSTYYFAYKDSTGSGGSTYTFSTGLTNTSSTITAKLSTGVSGGQAVYGGTASADTLRLYSTTHATKGKIKIGNTYYDETNDQLTMPAVNQSVTGSKYGLFFNYTSDNVSSMQGLGTGSGSTGNSYLLWATNKYYSAAGWVDNGLGRKGGAFQMVNDAFEFTQFNTGVTANSQKGFGMDANSNFFIGTTGAAGANRLDVRSGTGIQIRFGHYDPSDIYTYSLGRASSGAGYAEFKGYQGSTNVGYAFLDGPMIIAPSGSTGTNVTSTVSAFEVKTTAKLSVPAPLQTRTQRDAISSPVAGHQLYNTTTNTVNVHNGTNFTGDLTVSSAATLTLTHGTDYLFTGTTTTWTLPVVSSSLLGRANGIMIKNRGSGAITLNCNTGSVLYTTSAVASITIAAGAACFLLPDGTYFNVQYNL